MRARKLIGLTILTLIMCGVTGCKAGKIIAYSDIAGGTEVRELESIPLSVATYHATGSSVEWRVVPSWAGEFSPGVGLETIFIANPVSGTTDVTIHALFINDQQSTVVKKKTVTITDLTGWCDDWHAHAANQAQAIENDSLGRSYVCGSFYNSLDLMIDGQEVRHFNTGELGDFVFCLDQAGRLVWAREINADDPDYYVVDLFLDDDYVYVTSYRTMSPLRVRTRILKLDLAGARQWEIFFQGAINKIVTDQSGYFYITGEYFSPRDFDPGPGKDMHEADGQDALLCKFTSDGFFEWGRSWGGDDESLGWGDKGLDLFITDNGFVYVLGQYATADCDFEPGPGVETFDKPGTGSFGAISKYSTEGEYISTQILGSNPYVRPLGMECDPDGNIYIFGTANGETDFDLGPGSAYYETQGMFLAKYTSGWELIWIDCWSDGTPGFEQFMEVSADGCPVIVGTHHYDRPFEFDPHGSVGPIKASGYRSGFVLMLNPDGSLKDIDEYGVGSCYFTDFSIDAGGNLFIIGTLTGLIKYREADDIGILDVYHRETRAFILSVYE